MLKSKFYVVCILPQKGEGTRKQRKNTFLSDKLNVVCILIMEY